MALKKAAPENNIDNADKRIIGRDREGLIHTLLNSSDITEKRWAARDLVEFPDSVATLGEALKSEDDHVVREAIFSTLQTIGNQDVVSTLIPFLGTEDAMLRNSAIEVLQAIPNEISEHIIALLNHQDSDVRIFAIDILQVLAHENTPDWLLSVLKDETHVNVVATALDRLAEVGTPEMVDDVLAVQGRFKNEPYIQFACETALRRIRDEG